MPTNIVTSELPIWNAMSRNYELWHIILEYSWWLSRFINCSSSSLSLEFPVSFFYQYRSIYLSRDFVTLFISISLEIKSRKQDKSFLFHLQLVLNTLQPHHDETHRERLPIERARIFESKNWWTECGRCCCLGSNDNFVMTHVKCMIFCWLNWIGKNRSVVNKPN